MEVAFCYHVYVYRKREVLSLFIVRNLKYLSVISPHAHLNQYSIGKYQGVPVQRSESGTRLSCYRQNAVDA